MKQLFLNLLLVVCSISITQAQEIEVRNVFGGQQYFSNGKVLRMRYMVKRMQSNPQAYEFVRKAQSNSTLANTLALAGGFLVGLPLGTAIAGGTPNWTLAGIGVGVVVVGIPINKTSDQYGRQAVAIYNAGLSSTNNYRLRPQYKIGVSGNGLGLSMTF